MTSCRTKTETVSLEWRKLNHSIIVAAISQWRRRLSAWLTVDILSTFCGVFMIQCVQLTLRIFEFGVLLFDCFVYRRNITCLKCFTMYRHYAGEMEYDIIVGRLAVVVEIAEPKIRAFSCGLMTLC